MNKDSSMNNVRNCSLDLWRFVAAVHVLGMHLLFITDDNILYNFLSITTRYVVQFFICVTGYYYCKSLVEKKPIFKKQFLQLLKVYFVWTAIYYSASFVQSVLIDKTPISTFLHERVIFFFTEGSYSHFWNFPAVLYSMIIVTVVFKIWKERGVFYISIISVVLFIIGTLGSPYNELFSDVPIISQFFEWEGFFTFRNIFLIGLPFFTLGYLLSQYQNVFMNFKKNSEFIFLTIISIAFLIESAIIIFVCENLERSHILFSVYPFVAILAIVLIKNPLPQLSKASNLFRQLANFLYFVHPLLYLSLTLALGIVGVALNPIIMLLVVAALSILMGMVLIKINTTWSKTLLGLPTRSKKIKQ